MLSTIKSSGSSSSVVSFTQFSHAWGRMPLSALSLWPGRQPYRPRLVEGRRGGGPSSVAPRSGNPPTGRCRYSPISSLLSHGPPVYRYVYMHATSAYECELLVITRHYLPSIRLDAGSVIRLCRNRDNGAYSVQLVYTAVTFFKRSELIDAFIFATLKQ